MYICQNDLIEKNKFKNDEKAIKNDDFFLEKRRKKRPKNDEETIISYI